MMDQESANKVKKAYSEIKEEYERDKNLLKFKEEIRKEVERIRAIEEKYNIGELVPVTWMSYFRPGDKLIEGNEVCKLPVPMNYSGRPSRCVEGLITSAMSNAASLCSAYGESKEVKALLE